MVKANIVNEYQRRQSEAMENKKRIEGQLMKQDEAKVYQHHQNTPYQPSQNNKAVEQVSTIVECIGCKLCCVRLMAKSKRYSFVFCKIIVLRNS